MRFWHKIIYLFAPVVRNVWNSKYNTFLKHGIHWFFSSTQIDLGPDSFIIVFMYGGLYLFSIIFSPLFNENQLISVYCIL